VWHAVHLPVCVAYIVIVIVTSNAAQLQSFWQLPTAASSFAARNLVQQIMDCVWLKKLLVSCE
jgi:hypothetical protein